MMKIISTNLLRTLIILLPFSTSLSQDSWEKLDIQTTQDLKSVFFVDSLYGWIVGDSGIILNTTDGGDSWTFQDSQTENEIYTVFFLDRYLGWASSFDFTTLPYKTNILKTTDGGEEWSSTPYQENDIFITSIFYFDSQTGWMGGMPHALVKTTNGGQNWKQADIDSTVLAYFPVLNITFYDENHGFAGGGMFDIAGTMWRTTNGGENWQPVDAIYAPADEIHKVYMIDPMNIMAAGGDPDFGYGVAIMKSSDGGNSWSYEELGMGGTAYDLEFRTDNEIWCPLGQNRTLIYSLDAGDSWSEVPTPDSTAIFDITFPDPLHGFAIGMDGAVLRFVNSVPTTTGGTNLSISTLQLDQNFPNPFSSDTRINFTIPEKIVNRTEGSVNVELNIYNLQGEVVKTILNRQLPAGDYQQTISGEELPRGRYLYRLSINGGEKSIAKQMIKIK